MLKRMLIAGLCLGGLFVSDSAFAGGPLLVGGPQHGHPGQPFIWNPARMPIQYRVDPGPLAVNPSGQVLFDNASGLQRLQGIVAPWQNVATAAVSFANAGSILPAGSYTGGDITTAAQFNAVMGSCNAGTQSPVIFDADAGIMTALGLPSGVIGITSHCALDEVNGFILSAAILVNGRFIDGVNTAPNFELTANEFDESFTHEFGHLLGLDHSQINVELLQHTGSTCEPDLLAGLPVMFPQELCQARKDAGLAVLSQDDIAWISALYPDAQTPNVYGLISGVIYFSDGTSHVQGVNVIARAVDDPATPEDESRRTAFSAVSGYLFTSNPGQSVTGDNTGGNKSGSRDPQLIGYYQIPVRAGTYTVEVQSINASFTAGSSVGPLKPPVPMPGVAEFWNNQESPFDFPQQRDTIAVHPGDHITGIDIILNATPPRFDQFEDGALLLAPTRRNPSVGDFGWGAQ